MTKLLKRWGDVLLITLVVRTFLFIFGFIVSNQKLTDFFNIWVHWDGPHYISIAQHGYETIGDPANFIVFYPFYPLIIKVFSLIIGDFPASAVLASTVLSLITAILLYELVSMDEDHPTALLSVWWLNIFPLSYFLQASYTESLFLVASLGAIYFFRRKQVLLSGLFGAVATATRVNGILLFPLLIFFLKKPQQLFALILTSFGLLGYLAVNYILYHNPFYFSNVLNEHWYKHLELPWNGILNLVHSLPPLATENSYIFWSEIVAIVILFFLTILVFFKTKFSYGIYVVLNFLLFTSTSFILSTPRYILILFPIYIAIAKIKNIIIFFILSLISLGLLLYLTSIYVSGRWAY